VALAAEDYLAVSDRNQRSIHDVARCAATLALPPECVSSFDARLARDVAAEHVKRFEGLLPEEWLKPRQ